MKRILTLSAAALLLANPALAAPHHAADTADMSADQLNAQVNGEALQTARDALTRGTMTTDQAANMMARGPGAMNGMAPPPRSMPQPMMMRDGMAPPPPPPSATYDDGDHLLHAPAGM